MRMELITTINIKHIIFGTQQNQSKIPAQSKAFSFYDPSIKIEKPSLPHQIFVSLFPQSV